MKMYYIERQNDELVKYEVVIDQKELEKIKYKVIRNCGKINHRVHISDYGLPRELSRDHIANYSYEKIGVQEYFEETRDVYQYEYDEYSDTTLVTLIDRLLDGDMSAIAEIKNPKNEERKPDNGDELQKKLEKVLSLDTKEISTYQLEKIKNEIVEYQTNEKLNRDRKSDLEYYEPVLSCIDMKEVNRMRIDSLIKVDELMNQTRDLINEMKPFFEETNEKNIWADEYQKVIQKIYH